MSDPEDHYWEGYSRALRHAVKAIQEAEAETREVFMRCPDSAGKDKLALRISGLRQARKLVEGLE